MAIVVDGNTITNTTTGTSEVSPMEINVNVNNGFPYINGILLDLGEVRFYEVYSLSSSDVSPVIDSLDLIESFKSIFSIDDDCPYIESLNLIGLETLKLTFSIDDDCPYISNIKLYEPFIDKPYPRVLFLFDINNQSYPYQVEDLHEPLIDKPYPEILCQFSIKDKKEYDNLYRPLLDEPLYNQNIPKLEYGGSFQNSVILNVTTPMTTEVIGKNAFANTNLEFISISPKVKYDKQTTFPDTVKISYY